MVEEELAHVKVEKQEFEKSLTDSREYFEAEITSLVQEKNTFQDNYDQMKKHYDGEVKHYQQLAARREEELGVLRGEVSLLGIPADIFAAGDEDQGGSDSTGAQAQAGHGGGEPYTQCQSNHFQLHLLHFLIHNPKSYFFHRFFSSFKSVFHVVKF